jgi:hypothetical protein
MGFGVYLGESLHSDQESPGKLETKMEDKLSSGELSAWNNFVEAHKARQEAKKIENSACQEYMRAMDISLEAMKSEQAAFDVWLRIKKSLPPIGPVRRFPTWNELEEIEINRINRKNQK